MIEYKSDSFKITDMGNGIWYVFHFFDKWSATFDFREDVEIIVDSPFKKWKKMYKR